MSEGLELHQLLQALQAAVADPLGAGPINATLEKTVAEGYAGTAWDTFVRRLAHELCLTALDTLVQEVGAAELARMPADAFTAAVTTQVTTGASVPLQERLTHLLTRTAEGVAFEVATTLVLQSPALADLEHLLSLPQTAPPRLHRQGVLPLLREARLFIWFSNVLVFIVCLLSLFVARSCFRNS